MRSLSTAKFKKRVEELEGDNYEVLGEYVNAHTPIKMKCNICNNIWKPRPCNFMYNNSRCPECRRNKLKRSQDEFIKLIFEETNNEYEVLSEYKRSDIKVKMKHKKCGYIWWVMPQNIIGGSRCPKCQNTLKRTTEDFKKVVENLTDDEYKVLSEYENSYVKVKMKHNIEDCQNIFEVVPASFIHAGTRCPDC